MTEDPTARHDEEGVTVPTAVRLKGRFGMEGRHCLLPAARIDGFRSEAEVDATLQMGRRASRPRVGEDGLGAVAPQRPLQTQKKIAPQERARKG